MIDKRQYFKNMKLVLNENMENIAREICLKNEESLPSDTKRVEERLSEYKTFFYGVSESHAAQCLVNSVEGNVLFGEYGDRFMGDEALIVIVEDFDLTKRFVEEFGYENFWVDEEKDIDMIYYRNFIVLRILFLYVQNEFMDKDFCFYLIECVRRSFKGCEENTKFVQFGLGMCSFLQGIRNKYEIGLNGKPNSTKNIEIVNLMFRQSLNMIIDAYYMQMQNRDELRDLEHWYFSFRYISPVIISKIFYTLDRIDECEYWLIRGELDGTLPPYRVIVYDPELGSHMDCLYETRNFLQQTASNEAELVAEAITDSNANLTESMILRSALSNSTYEIVAQENPLASFWKPVIPIQTNASKKRLADRMELYGVEAQRNIPGDGNCQFYSISDQLTGSLDYAGFIRRTVNKWLKVHGDYALSNDCFLKDFVVDKTWEEYLSYMNRETVWGDHLTLIAASEIFKFQLFIISSVPGDNFIVEINPEQCVPRRLVMISHFAEFHYGSVRHKEKHLRNPMF